MMWVWVFIAFVIGQIAGVICSVICFGSWDKAEEQIEKNRRRGDADDSKKGGSI